MNNKKYEITNDTTRSFKGTILHRIKAIKSFGDVTEGDLGGFIESEDNLEHNGNCWVYADAQVFDTARVWGNAQVCGNALVYNRARVSGNACIYEHAQVRGDAQVYGNTEMYDHAIVCDHACVSDDAYLSNTAYICDHAVILGQSKVYGDTYICGNTRFVGSAMVFDDAHYSTVHGFGTEGRTSTFFACYDGILRVACGCFYGNIDEFREQVKKTRTGKVAKEYLMLADLMEVHFGKEGND